MLINTDNYATYTILLDPLNGRVKKKTLMFSFIQLAVHMQRIPEMNPRTRSLWQGLFQGSIPAISIVENIWTNIGNVWKVCFCRRQSLLSPSGIWHSSLVAAHERFQLARTLITVILMRHMLISTINEGVWGKTTIYPSSVAHSDGCDRFCIHGLQPYIFRPKFNPQLDASSSEEELERLWKEVS